MLDWLKGIMGVCEPDDNQAFPFMTWLKSSTSSMTFPNFELRHVSIGFSLVSGNNGKTSLKFSNLSLDMELQFTTNSQTVLLLASFAYSTGGGPGLSLEADLWFGESFVWGESSKGTSVCSTANVRASQIRLSMSKTYLCRCCPTMKTMRGSSR
jgi:hypothetical protein